MFKIEKIMKRIQNRNLWTVKKNKKIKKMINIKKKQKEMKNLILNMDLKINN